MSRKKISVTLQLVKEGWQSPNSYSNAFATIPPRPGVYAIVVWPNLHENVSDCHVVYIGKSANLRQRLAGHEVLREITEYRPDAHVQKWFLSMARDQIDAAEISLIKRYKPAYNQQHCRRGLGDVQRASA